MNILCDKKKNNEFFCFVFSDMAVSTDNETRIALFQSIGLNEQKARETLKNQDVTRSLETTINEVENHFFYLFN